MTHKPDNGKKRVWNLDEETLNLAWFAYNGLPAADHHIPFGQWFMSLYYIPGLVEWPSLVNETDNEKALAMLREFIINGW